MPKGNNYNNMRILTRYQNVKFLSTAFQVLLLASFAMWFGGFGFYASFVVPVGNEMLGSFEQGLVTRHVTVWLNYLGVLAAVLMIIDSILTWKRSRSRVRYVQISCSIFMLAMFCIRRLMLTSIKSLARSMVTTISSIGCTDSICGPLLFNGSRRGFG
jgi:hypothetical protein